jgi:hypothetical protein
MRVYAKDSRAHRSMAAFSHNERRYFRNKGHRPAGFRFRNDKLTGGARVEGRDICRETLAAYRAEQAESMAQDSGSLYLDRIESEEYTPYDIQDTFDGYDERYDLEPLNDHLAAEWGIDHDEYGYLDPYEFGGLDDWDYDPYEPSFEETKYYPHPLPLSDEAWAPLYEASWNPPGDWLAEESEYIHCQMDEGSDPTFFLWKRLRNIP